MTLNAPIYPPPVAVTRLAFSERRSPPWSLPLPLVSAGRKNPKRHWGDRGAQAGGLGSGSGLAGES